MALAEQRIGSICARGAEETIGADMSKKNFMGTMISLAP